MEDRQWLILYVVVCLEVGLFLALVPWSAVWERNFFLDAYPTLRPILLDPALRGAVAGLGLANVYMGFREILGYRRAARGMGASAEEDLETFELGEAADPTEEREALAASEPRR